MGYEPLALAAGLILGALGVYLIVRTQTASRILSEAGRIAAQLFQTQKDQLEKSIRESYEAHFAKWKETTLAEVVKQNRTEAVDASRSVLKGKIAEQMAPMLPHFLDLYNPADARFIGSPIDYLIFKNMSHGNDSSENIEIVLLDGKTGSATLTPLQKRIQSAVSNKRISFQTLRFDRPSDSKPLEVQLPKEPDVQVIPIKDIPAGNELS